MNIIFLDIDGVLNSLSTAIAFNALNKPSDSFKLDEVSVGLVKAVCDLVNAEIVITSTWRHRKTKEDFIKIFKEYNWKNFPYFDKTPRSFHGSRGKEIEAWLSLQSNSDKINYIIIDDDSRDILHSQLSRFIHIDRNQGFRAWDYYKAISLFGDRDRDLEKIFSLK